MAQQRRDMDAALRERGRDPGIWAAAGFVDHVFGAGIVAQLSDRVAVMYHGRICEIGTAPDVLAPPYHPYTRILLASAADDEPAAEPAAGGTAAAAHAGCVFATRCPHKLGTVCDTTPPPLRSLSASHAIACHLDTMPDIAVLPVSVRADPQRPAV